MTPRTWLNASSKHEGLPIYFRRPNVPVAEFEALRPKYPGLLAITHRLARVTDGGAPEAAYNDSLAALDAALLAPFMNEADGLVALVETFAGKRTYYVYLAPSFDADAFMARIAAGFPGQALSWKRREDPASNLFHGYATDFRFG